MRRILEGRDKALILDFDCREVNDACSGTSNDQFSGRVAVRWNDGFGYLA